MWSWKNFLLASPVSGTYRNAPWIQDTIYIGLSMNRLDTHCQSHMWDSLHAKHSIVRAFLSTCMYIFHKAGTSDK